MRQKDHQDLLGGALIGAIGLFFALYGQRYDLGTASRMGAGFFPITLGWLLAGLGLLVALPALWRQGQPMVVQWKNWFWSVASLLVFAGLLYPLGVFLTAALTALVALMPSGLQVRQRLLVALCVATLTSLIFVLALNMHLPAWPLNL